MAAQTGNGTTLVLATDGTIGSIISMSGLSEDLPALDDTDLDTTSYMEMIPGDLMSLEPISVSVYWDGSSVPPTPGTVQTITITDSNSNTLSGTGFITNRSGPTHENNERLVGEITMQFDGKTGPTYA